MQKNISYQDWKLVRNTIAKHPNVGYDVLFAWDHHKAANSKTASPDDLQLRQTLETADTMMLNKDFEGAFTNYQTAVESMKASYARKVPPENQAIYFNTFHQMARALYGAKRFEEAIKVYSWIPRSYYQFRQVLFEKMWAGFRTNRFDIVLGSIYSQNSAYFSRFLEPESYLVKLYTTKKLCYDDEYNRTLEEIKTYVDLSKSNKLSLEEWAKSDIVYLSLYYLLQKKTKTNPQLQLIGEKVRKEERQKIAKYLQKNFESDKIRISTNLEKVLGYTQILKTGGNSVEQVNHFPKSSTLSEQGFEYWPNGNSEEWVDEVGSSYFIGESRCKVAEKVGSLGLPPYSVVQ
jgi:tetratricopeptide (TPR) repeat protein